MIRKDMLPDEKLATIWKSVLGELEVELGKNNFSLYIKNSQLLSIDRGVAKIGLVNKIIADQVNTRYYTLVQNSLQRLSKVEKLSLIFEIIEKPGIQNPESDPLSNTGPLFQTPKEDKEAIAKVIKTVGLRPEFSLEEFCVSTSNQLAFAAAQAVIQKPGKNYNPFFIWGGVGIGKTHLMQAIGHEMIRQKPEDRIVYVTAEQFTNEIIEGIRSKNTKDFKDKYRSAKALLVDDIQFIAGKDRAQEEFFHTFNTITQNGGQVVLTSDTKPSEIKFIEDRLRSRFEGGMVADISEPDHELKTAICILKAKKRGIELSTTTAAALVDSVDNIRSLEGDLQRLITEAEISKKPINEILVATLPKKSANIDSRQILDAVCQYYNLPIKLIKSEKRDKPISEPRQIIMYLLRQNTRMTNAEIASYLERKDHTTILHGVKKIVNLLSTNERVKKDIDKIQEVIHRYSKNLSTSL